MAVVLAGLARRAGAEASAETGRRSRPQRRRSRSASERRGAGAEPEQKDRASAERSAFTLPVSGGVAVCGGGRLAAPTSSQA